MFLTEVHWLRLKVGFKISEGGGGSWKGCLLVLLWLMPVTVMEKDILGD